MVFLSSRRGQRRVRATASRLRIIAVIQNHHSKDQRFVKVLTAMYDDVCRSRSTQPNCVPSVSGPGKRATTRPTCTRPIRRSRKSNGTATRVPVSTQQGQLPPTSQEKEANKQPMMTGKGMRNQFQPLHCHPRQSWERINDGSTDAASSTWRNSDAHTGDACREPMMPPPMQTMQAPGLCWNPTLPGMENFSRQIHEQLAEVCQAIYATRE